MAFLPDYFILLLGKKDDLPEKEVDAEAGKDGEITDKPIEEEKESPDTQTNNQ